MLVYRIAHKDKPSIGVFCTGDAGVADAQGHVDANFAACDVDVGLAVLRGLQEGGWRMGTPPKVVDDALKQMRHDGLTMPQIQAITGLSIQRIQMATWGKSRRKVLKDGRIRAAALLGVAQGNSAEWE